MVTGATNRVARRAPALLLAMSLGLCPVSAQEQPVSSCGDPARAALAEAAALVDRDDLSGAGERLARARHEACESLDVAQLALEGWITARAASAHGGATEHVMPAARVVAALEARHARAAWPLANEYARALITAAVAAAQDERVEMMLYLTHARSVSDRAPGAEPAWPLPIDLAEGELWLEVDGYEQAAAAFTRALASGRRGRAVLGLARTTARAGDQSAACARYREWLEQAPSAPSADEARSYLARCAH